MAKNKFSIEGITDALSWLDDRKLMLEQRMPSFLNKLSELGYTVVRAEILRSGAYYSGELYESVGTRQNDTEAIVYVHSDHAIFVEFGTGPVGKGGTQHPQTADPNPYVVGGTGKDHWTYFDEVAGEFRTTSGMQARPFMYMAMSRIKAKQIYKIAKEVFNV